MGLPIPDKTWNKELNVEFRTLGDGKQDRREILFQIKERLKNMAVPWVVQYSSDGVTAGTAGDLVDRWASRADVSFGDSGVDGQTGVSWMVMKQSAISTNFQIMFKCERSNPAGAGNLEMHFSPADGFTGGTTGDTTPPSATDSIQVLGTSYGQGAAWLDGTNASAPTTQDFILHFWQSSDGECTRIFAYDVTDVFNCMHVAFEKPKNPIAEWADPGFVIWYSPTSAANQFADFNDTSANCYANNPNGGEMKMLHTCEGYGAAMNPQNESGVNELSGDYEFYPMGLSSNTTLAGGRHGERFDIWWVPTSMLNGMTVPLTPSATREFAVFDDMLMVWDGTLPVLI